MNTLIEGINEFRKLGFTHDFSVEKGLLQSKDPDKKFRAEELIIEDVLRFEGDSNPSDMSVLYAIKASDGTKGIILDAYGAYEDAGIGEFIKKVKLGNK